MDNKKRKLNLLVKEYKNLELKEKRIQEQKQGVYRKYQNLKLEIERYQAQRNGTTENDFSYLDFLSPETREQVLVELKRRGF